MDRDVDGVYGGYDVYNGMAATELTGVAWQNGPVAAIYKEIARKVAVQVAEKAKDMSSKFPTIVVKND